MHNSGLLLENPGLANQRNCWQTIILHYGSDSSVGNNYFDDGINANKFCSIYRVQGGNANQSKGIMCLILALVCFIVGLVTCILWICLWPAAIVLLIMGIYYLVTPDETHVATV